jgi:DNA modification methylase
MHNTHHAVKPVELLRWLIRLVVPEGGTVCDPFLGSGSTGCACMAEGAHFIGMEREVDYAELAKARIEGWAKAKRAGRLS